MEVMKEAVEVLKGARTILEKHQNWTKATYARNNKGEDVQVLDTQACRFCTLGALHKAAKVDEYGGTPTRVKQAAKMLQNVFGGDIPDVNDHPTTKHKHVLMAFDLAILQGEDALLAAKKTK